MHLSSPHVIWGGLWEGDVSMHLRETIAIRYQLFRLLHYSIFEISMYGWPTCCLGIYYCVFVTVFLGLVCKTVHCSKILFCILFLLLLFCNMFVHSYF